MDGGNEYSVKKQFSFKAGISATEKLVLGDGLMGKRL
jgi:hypothetical protein